ncbi:DUF4407 domain-containing protein [Sediminibacterium ginsengisoli]|uniref:DUF4407 domain-containing protein n=1 Tax=Sediminibacterium ginsengisoli TaxID=413434 RepID=A0A1T4PY23_9BACT|nr:DUF4407 domain-containing protein [Sediminibacterium ginsengisoli]SJZ96217.1 protein of unknown function [Sediminibacterium ginsengisoli]
MQENNTPVPGGYRYAPTPATRFLWWLSTAEADLLRDCSIDRGRYAIIGMNVLATWLFATLAWTYFFSTVTPYLMVAILLGILMGGIVLSIDRTLIRGISRSSGRKAVPVLFRLLLALVIGLFMAQPALLYLFNKEIKVQVSLDNEIRRKEKLAGLDSLYQPAVTSLNLQKQNLQAELTARYREVAAARENFIAETDGTGGSGKVGMKDIAQAKQREYQKLDEAYRQLGNNLQPQLQRADSNLQVLSQRKIQEQAAFDQLLNDGFITRIEALQHLVSNNTAVAYRYYLLVALLMLIELMPVIAKLVLPEGSYEEKLKLREQLEKELQETRHAGEMATGKSYIEKAGEHDRQLLAAFFAATDPVRQQALQQKIKAWQESGQPFKSLYEELKKELATHA